MKNHFFIILFFGFLVFVNSVSATTLQNFNSNFTGKLGSKTEVVFSLRNNHGKLSGFYYYENVGIEIKLAGEVINGMATIYELDYQNVKKAKITGKFTQGSFKGNWESLSSKKVYPIQLTPTGKTIPMLPNYLMGNYQVDEQDKCALSMTIFKSKGVYYYHFKSSARNINGKVTFSRSLDEKLVYINFEGIEWDEDSGDVTKSDDEESSSGNDSLPTVVQGLLSDCGVIIQNTGNAMNRYVKIAECDLKYIHLKRVN
ncbi:hypothetical protein SAMN05421827_10292 [Pedobacter terrae]|uniref:Uncharacterized protein n=1 Tax=Pedobacter terrae TaxID=405671 RepID=A0A1G7PYH0_9SPHI|nr:hypothetical protein [Pedobacter terrae]SDF91304.1 hypothetical protein SAMN05421827_10292 [Pedobacter terrae]